VDLETIRSQVIIRYGTIHAFAKKRPGGLARSTIYQVLNGKYGGDTARQLERIQTALDGPALGIFEVLRQVACARCRKKRRRSRQCEKCAALWIAQEKELMAALGQGGDRWAK